MAACTFEVNQQPFSLTIGVVHPIGGSGAKIKHRPFTVFGMLVALAIKSQGKAICNMCVILTVNIKR